MLCIGDGYIFVFTTAFDATVFTAFLAHLVEERRARRSLPVDFHFRMGIHFGEVYRFWDFGRSDWNYVGEGINGGSPVLEVVGKQTDDVVFVSSDVRDEIYAERDRRHRLIPDSLLDAMDNRGRREDKHHKPWRVYELNHTAFITRLVS